MIQGLLAKNLTQEVAEKTGHPDLCLKVILGAHAFDSSTDSS